MTKKHAFDTYRQYPPFNNLTINQLNTLSAQAITHTYGANDTLYRVGDKEQTLSIIEEGQVQITSLSQKGNFIDLQTVGKGSLIGEIGFLSGRPHRTDAIAKTPTTTIALPRAAIKPLIQASPELLNGLIDILCQKITYFQDTYLATLNAPLKNRLAKKLLSLSGHTIGAEVFISHEALGQSLGNCRESVSRCLAGFRNAGIIQTGHSCIQILDRERLKKFTLA
jgi:CRP-like cAMP-binding protein